MIEILSIEPIYNYAGLVLKHPRFKNELSVIYGKGFHTGKMNLFEVSCCYSRFKTWKELIYHLDKCKGIEDD